MHTIFTVSQRAPTFTGYDWFYLEILAIISHVSLDRRPGRGHDTTGYVVADRLPKATDISVSCAHSLPALDHPPGH